MYNVYMNLNIEKQKNRKIINNHLELISKKDQRVTQGETSEGRFLKIESNIQKNETPFATKYWEFRKSQYENPSDCYLNLNKVLYDPEISSLGDAEIIQNVTNEDWKLMYEWHKQYTNEITALKQNLTTLWIKHCIAHYLNIIYKTTDIESQQKEINDQIAKLTDKQKHWENFAVWMDKLLQSEDGIKNPNMIKSRVFNLYKQIMDGSDNQQSLLSIISEYSDACVDRAVVGLEKAETRMQVSKLGEDLAINVLILEFKRHLIQLELVPMDSRESVETYLFYSLYFNDVLMLKNKNSLMSFAQVAQRSSLSDSINKIFKRITIEDLVGFISNHEIFHKNYEKEYAEIVDRLQGKIAEMDFNDPEIVTVNNEYINVTSNFYQDKAKVLLMKKGFLTPDVNYEDPSSFSKMKLPESKEFFNRLLTSSSWNFVQYIMVYQLDTIRSMTDFCFQNYPTISLNTSLFVWLTTIIIEYKIIDCIIETIAGGNKLASCCMFLMLYMFYLSPVNRVMRND